MQARIRCYLNVGENLSGSHRMVSQFDAAIRINYLRIGALGLEMRIWFGIVPIW